MLFHFFQISQKILKVAVERGLPPDTLAVAVERGTTPQQLIVSISIHLLPLLADMQIFISINYACSRMVEGNHMRLSGQDVERGNFSYTHSTKVGRVG